MNVINKVEKEQSFFLDFFIKLGIIIIHINLRKIIAKIREVGKDLIVAINE